MGEIAADPKRRRVKVSAVSSAGFLPARSSQNRLDRLNSLKAVKIAGVAFGQHQRRAVGLW